MDEDLNDTTTSGDDIDVDALLHSIENPAPSGIVDNPATPAAATPEVEKPWEAPEWAQFDINGKKVGPDSAEKARQWIEMGRNYSQRMADFNRTKTEFDEKFKRFNEIEEYGKANPQFLEHLYASWDARTQAAAAAGQPAPQLPPELAAAIKPLQDELAQLKPLISDFQKAKAEVQAKEQDQALDAEIDTIRKRHPNIDLKSVDESGKTVEQRVYAHATANDFRTFKSAFYDLFADKLMEVSKANGREGVAREQQANAKKGILGKTPAPVKATTPAQNHRAKSYDELTEEFKREHGIGSR